MMVSPLEHRRKAIPPVLRSLASVLLIIFIAFIIGGTGCGLLLMTIDSGLCGNEISQEVFSPDGEYKAVVFQRDCGATTGFSTQISIMRATDELPNKPGNIFVMDGHPDWTEVHVQWETDRSVVISYSSKYEVFQAKDRLRDFLTVIEVKYQGHSE